MITPGKFSARAIKWEVGYTKNNFPQVGVIFELESGDRIKWYGSLHEKSKFYTCKSLVAAGWDGSDPFDKLNGIGKKSCRVTIEEDSYQGQTKLIVKWVNVSLGGEVCYSLAEGNNLDSINMQMRGMGDAAKSAIQDDLKKLSAGGTAHQRIPADDARGHNNGSSYNQTDDDIPF